MTQEQKHIAKSPLSDLKNSFQNFLSTYTKRDKSKEQQKVVSENRYSVLYTLKSQYHHIGCSSQAEAQSVLGLLMTDGNRIPVGIYDEKTDTFEWEIIGQYFHSQDSASEQNSRLEEVLTISRALRRRDSSWQPGYLQKPSFFA
ncbi:hypothetical protein ACFP1I_30365 [Dyadobacter subterraneus]|uniref:hypothetical protein n=1 Tax=Dyadobacter subterraneus TaxID=2773304 RepID=UPI001D160668|nr:hypothetical protein [Dyadobacter subterraneus]